MNRELIETKLTKLTDLKCAEDAIRLRYEERIAAVKAPLQSQVDALMATVQTQIDAIMAKVTPEIDPLLDSINEKTVKLESACRDEIAETKNEADQLEQEVRAAVIELGETVKVKGAMQCVYVAGKVTYDPKALDGVATVYPAILAFRHEGEPSTQIRKA